MQDQATSIFDPHEFLPAAGQGAIAIETRRDDERVNALVAAIDDKDTEAAVAAERGFLALLDGSCRTPIAAHAIVDGERIRFRGLIVSPDGARGLRSRARGLAPRSGHARRRCRARGARARRRKILHAVCGSVRRVAVLVTRPEPDNDATAVLLRARGFEPLLAPMLAFQPLPFRDETDAAYRGVILTSANAIRAIATHPILLRLQALPVFAVGARTAEAARDVGFRDVRIAEGDAAALRELVVASVPARKNSSAFALSRGGRRQPRPAQRTWHTRHRGLPVAGLSHG